jgi:hypothetical protein
MENTHIQGLTPFMKTFSINTLVSFYFLFTFPSTAQENKAAKPLWFINFNQSDCFLMRGKIELKDNAASFFVEIKSEGKKIGECELNPCVIKLDENTIKLINIGKYDAFLDELDEVKKAQLITCYYEIRIIEGMPVTSVNLENNKDAWFVLKSYEIAGRNFLSKWGRSLEMSIFCLSPLR